jgi:hypothetical protein
MKPKEGQTQTRKVPFVEIKESSTRVGVKIASKESEERLQRTIDRMEELKKKKK